MAKLHKCGGGKLVKVTLIIKKSCHHRLVALRPKSHHLLLFSPPPLPHPKKPQIELRVKFRTSVRLAQPEAALSRRAVRKWFLRFGRGPPCRLCLWLPVKQNIHPSNSRRNRSPALVSSPTAIIIYLSSASDSFFFFFLSLAVGREGGGRGGATASGQWVFTYQIIDFFFFFPFASCFNKSCFGG